MAAPIIGRDAVVYTVQGYGLDPSPQGGATYNYLGTWKDITFKIRKNWVDRTPSGAKTDIKRKTTDTCSLSMKNLILETGSQAIPIVATNDMIYVTFQESGTGLQWFALVGITEGGGEYGKDTGDDSIEGESVGYLPDGVSLPFGVL